MRRIAHGLLAVACALALPAHAAAQTHGVGRAAVEAVAAVASTSDAPDDPFVWLDLTTTVRVHDNLDVIVRPYARRLPGGDWDLLFYQAQIRYQPVEGVRIDAGIITSPIGLGTLELRPDLNPVVSYPFYYFSPLPRFDEYNNSLQILSGGYPFGAVASWSNLRWDARAGITDSTPARYRKSLFGDGPSSAPQFVAGGGFTPITGLRFGTGLSVGKYRRSDDVDYFQGPGGELPTDADALVFNIEGEYSFAYTRLSGEWVRDRFDTNTGRVVSHGAYLQAVQTFTPRTFGAARFVHSTTPVRAALGLVERDRSVAEVTGGFRVTPSVTLKAGYQASRAFGVSDWNHTAIWSLVWSQRWF